MKYCYYYFYFHSSSLPTIPIYHINTFHFLYIVDATMADRIAKAQNQENSAHEQQQQANARSVAINNYSRVVEYYRMKYNEGPNAGGVNSNEIALNSNIILLVDKYSSSLKKGDLNLKSTEEIIKTCEEMKKEFTDEVQRYHIERMKQLEEERKRREEMERIRRIEEEKRRKEEEERKKEELKQKVMRWQKLDEDSRNLICFLSAQDYEFLKKEKEVV